MAITSIAADSVKLLNETPFAGAYAPGRLKSGRDCLVLVAKATYSLPAKTGDNPTLASEQLPPSAVDIPLGDPSHTPILYEHDFVPFKPNCDIILIGSAYAPPRHMTRLVNVTLGVDTMSKSFAVIGHRRWKAGIVSLKASEPEPFDRLPIHYGVAYGGMGNLDDPAKRYGYAENLLGVGYYGKSPGKSWLDKPLPNTMELNKPVENDIHHSRPMSFGVIAKNSPRRLQYAGTYDQTWEQTKAPFLPDDFDERFYQCAPTDQQVPHLKGGERVTLTNVTPDNQRDFKLPVETLRMHAVYRNGNRTDLDPAIDTLVFEPDENRFSIIWRARVPLNRRMSEVDTLIIGTPTPAWERARLTGKTYVPLAKIHQYRHVLNR